MRFLPSSQQFGTLDGRVRRRLVVAFAFGAALVAAAVVMAVKEAEAPRGLVLRPAMGRPVDPLAAEFARCQALGEAGANDTACLAAWAENRRRFLSPDHRVLGLNPAAAPEGAR